MESELKRYLIDLLISIPLALGIILTVFSIVNAIGSPDDSDKGLIALVCGIVGIPLLFTSTTAILRRSSQ